MTPSKSSGFTLIELMIGITIFALTLSLGVSSFRTWIQNTQIRNAAESIQNGLQRARAEAVRRNTNVAFTLGTDSAWTISVVSGGEVIESRSSSEGSKNVSADGVDAGAFAATTITFNNFAGIVANANTLNQVALDSTTLSAADSKELEVRIGVGGNIKMCDPNPLAPDSMAC